MVEYIKDIIGDDCFGIVKSYLTNNTIEFYNYDLFLYKPDFDKVHFTMNFLNREYHNYYHHCGWRDMYGIYTDIDEYKETLEAFKKTYYTGVYQNIFRKEPIHYNLMEMSFDDYKKLVEKKWYQCIEPCDDCDKYYYDEDIKFKYETKYFSNV